MLENEQYNALQQTKAEAIGGVAATAVFRDNFVSAAAKHLPSKRQAKRLAESSNNCSLSQQVAAAGLKDARRWDSDNVEVQGVEDELAKEAVGRPQRRESSSLLAFVFPSVTAWGDLAPPCLER